MRRLHHLRPVSGRARLAPILGLVAGGVLGVTAIGLVGLRRWPSGPARIGPGRPRGDACPSPADRSRGTDRSDVRRSLRLGWCRGSRARLQRRRIALPSFERARRVSRSSADRRGRRRAAAALCRRYPRRSRVTGKGSSTTPCSPPPTDARSTVPPGGAEAPHRVHLLVDAVDVDLGAHAFGTPALRAPVWRPRSGATVRPTSGSSRVETSGRSARRPSTSMRRATSSCSITLIAGCCSGSAEATDPGSRPALDRGSPCRHVHRRRWLDLRSRDRGAPRPETADPTIRRGRAGARRRRGCGAHALPASHRADRPGRSPATVESVDAGRGRRLPGRTGRAAAPCSLRPSAARRRRGRRAEAW